MDPFMDDYKSRLYLRYSMGLGSSRAHAIVRPEPPRDVRSEALEGLGRLDVILLREWVAPGLPTMSKSKTAELGWTWLENAPAGPSTEGIAALERLQQKYGAPAVTTGDANPPAPGLIGLYVQTSALRQSGASER